MSFSLGCSVTALVSCGMSSPTIHIAAILGILLQKIRVVRAPSARIQERCGKRQAERDRLQLETTGEAALSVQYRFVLNDPRHHGSTIEVHGLLEDAEDGTRRMPHIIPADLA